MRPYNEIRLGLSQDREAIVGAAIGALVAILFVWDVIDRIKDWLVR